MVVGIGVDITEHARMEDVLASSGDAFERYTFTEAERAEAAEEADRTAYLAGRFCVKEAVIKAIGALVDHVNLKDVETLHGEDGAPTLRIHGDLARDLPAGLDFQVSLSHESSLSIAFVIAQRQGERAL